MVRNTNLDQAEEDANSYATAVRPDTVPYMTAPMVTFAAKAGLHQIAGQHIEAAAGETLTLAAGQDFDQAIGGTARIHTGQAIGMLAGAVKPGDQAAGKGITMIANRGAITVESISDMLQLAAKHDVHLQSQLAGIDFAAAKRIKISEPGGASITIANGGIVPECPGTITVYASKKSFVGPVIHDHPLPTLPQQVCVECLLKAVAVGSPMALT